MAGPRSVSALGLPSGAGSSDVTHTCVHKRGRYEDRAVGGREGRKEMREEKKEGKMHARKTGRRN